MGQVFLRGLLHQKLFGRSPPVHDSATRFHRHRRAADPSPFFKCLDDTLVLGRVATVIAELGDITRFANPRQLMAGVRRVPPAVKGPKRLILSTSRFCSASRAQIMPIDLAPRIENRNALKAALFRCARAVA
jgi:hypothetical protein